MAISTVHLPALRRLRVSADEFSTGRVYRISGESNAENLIELSQNTTIEIGPFADPFNYAIDSDKGLLTAEIEATTGSGIEAVIDDLNPSLGGDLNLNTNGLDFPTTPDVDDCIDDDTMTTASATSLATSESIKAYVDNNQSWVEISRADNLNDIIEADFTGMTDDFDMYALVFNNIQCDLGATEISLRFSNDNGATYDSGLNYAAVVELTTTAPASAQTGYNGGDRIDLTLLGAGTDTVGKGLNGVVWINAARDTSTATATSAILTGSPTNLTQSLFKHCGWHLVNDATDAIRVRSFPGMFGTSIILYGIR